MNVIHRFSSKRAMLLGAGVLLLGLGAFAVALRSSCHESHQVDRWALQAERDPGCYYGSSWKDGDLMMRHQSLVATNFTHRYQHVDGCTWDVVESLVPDGPNHFHYQYDEQPVSCREGAVPLPACPLTGSVVVTPVGE